MSREWQKERIECEDEMKKREEGWRMCREDGWRREERSLGERAG